MSIKATLQLVKKVSKSTGNGISETTVLLKYLVTRELK